MRIYWVYIIKLISPNSGVWDSGFRIIADMHSWHCALSISIGCNPLGYQVSFTGPKTELKKKGIKQFLAAKIRLKTWKEES